jgi:hypothetical protein
VAREDEVKADPTRVKLTYDDFLLFPDDGKRHELIDGEHYVTPSPNMKHQAISGNLFFMIRSWLEQHSVGRIFYAPFDVVFTNFDVVEPDLLYMSHDRAAQVLTPKHVTGPPEIVSRSVHQARESGTKRSNAVSTSAALYRSTGSSTRISSWSASTAIRTVSSDVRAS